MFAKKRKVIWITLLVLSVLGIGAYHVVLDVAAKKLYSEISTPEFQQTLEQVKDLSENKAVLQQITATAQSKPTEDSTYEPSKTTEIVKESAPTPSVATPKPVSTKKKVSFKSRNDAVKFVLSRFTLSEAKHVQGLLAEGLTAENKTELKNIAFEKFTWEEIKAVQEALQ